MTPYFSPPNNDTLASIKPTHPLKWKDYAEWWLSFPLGRVLDFGCGQGDFLARVTDRSTLRCGVDVDPDDVSEARRTSDAHVSVVGTDGRLPFADASFDTVVILEVIEHVADERSVLCELARVLAPGGRLLLTTPHKGLLTFLDPGNFKFVAPRVHRWIHGSVLRREDYYDQRFGAARRDDRRMVADFTLDQDPWHRHYRARDIESLKPAELNRTASAVYYPAFRALWTLRLVLKVVTRGRLQQLPRPLRWLDRKMSRIETTLGDQLVMLFEKETPNG